MPNNNPRHEPQKEQRLGRRCTLGINNLKRQNITFASLPPSLLSYDTRTCFKKKKKKKNVADLKLKSIMIHDSITILFHSVSPLSNEKGIKIIRMKILVVYFMILYINFLKYIPISIDLKKKKM